MVKKRYLWHHPDGRWYLRIKSKYHRIEAEAGTADFDRQYWEILTGKQAEAKTSWRALVASYRRSDRWTGLKPRTRADYEKVLSYWPAAGFVDTGLGLHSSVLERHGA